LERVFISYLREDGPKVEPVTRAFDDAQVPYWLDRDQIRPGDNWKLAVRDAILGGAMFVPFFSERFAERQSAYMHEEIELAAGLYSERATTRRWLIPVCLDRCQVPAIPIGPGAVLSDVHSVSLAGESWAAGVAALIEHLSPKQKMEFKDKLVHAAIDIWLARIEDREEQTRNLHDMWGGRQSRDSRGIWSPGSDRMFGMGSGRADHAGAAYDKLKREFEVRYGEIYDPYRNEGGMIGDRTYFEFAEHGYRRHGSRYRPF
jgi:hypothetical protein